eukprot:Skav204721  [mRNA]  locus=scaffold1549:158218:162144:+ [translate_table: standard]
MSTIFVIFPVLASLANLANGQSQSSCLVQARMDASKRTSGRRTFSPQQQQCIEDYVADVRSIMPDYDLSERRFGGVSTELTTRLPILGAGFGTTATRSLSAFARQLGLQVHHYDKDKVWSKLLKLLTQNCSSRQGLDEVNYSQILLDTGAQLFLDTPMGELFLDFYASSPNSKVILTTRDAEVWAKSRLAHHDTTAMPIQSPCGGDLSSLTVENSAELFRKHAKLVRCMVPPEHLLDVDVFEQPNSTRIAEFLGVTTPFYVPLPKDFPKSKRLPICITGQIRRLELQSKIQSLIKPSLQAGYRVEVYLVMDPRYDGTAYVHREPGSSVGNYTISEGRFFSLNETVELFPKNTSVIFDPFIPKDFLIDPRYVLMMEAVSNHSHDETPLENALSRARQWEALSRCFELFHVINQHPPEVAVRLRDDLSILDRFVPPFPTMEKGVHVQNCEHFGGLNDKGAMIKGPEAVRNYFTETLQLMRDRFSQVMSVQNARTTHPMNPESIMWNSLLLSNTAVHYSDNFPVAVRTVMEDSKKQRHLCYKARQIDQCLSKSAGMHFKARASSITKYSKENYACEGPSSP